jgi:hypothetical protein
MCLLHELVHYEQLRDRKPTMEEGVPKRAAALLKELDTVEVCYDPDQSEAHARDVHSVMTAYGDWQCEVPSVEKIMRKWEYFFSVSQQMPEGYEKTFIL